MKKRVPIKYIDIIKDMYDGVVTNIRTYGDITNDFSITIGLHQGSALSPFLFVIMMGELTRAILLAQGYNHPFLVCFDDYKIY